MKKSKKRRILPLILIPALIFLVLIVTATTLLSNRRSSSDHGGGQSLEEIQQSVADEYVFLAQSGFMRLNTGNAEMIHGLVTHGELIYYLYVENIEWCNSNHRA